MLIQKYIQKLKDKSIYAWILGVLILALLIFYSFILWQPAKVEFSFAKTACVSQFVPFPSVYKSSSDSFAVEYQGEAVIGEFVVFATGICLSPSSAPDSGVYDGSVSLFGSALPGKQFTITVPESPMVNTTDLGSTPISTHEPLKVELSSGDVFHTYKLTLDDEQVGCSVDASLLSCNVAEIKLMQGEQYLAQLYRSFKGEGSEKMIESTVTTLAPTVVSEATISEGQTLYDMPQDFIFTLDQPVKSAEASLFITDGDQLASTVVAQDNKVVVSASEALPRNAKISIKLNQVVAQNGAGLEQPYVVNFATSGGPKVSAISASATSVSSNERIVITFDQPIKPDLNLSDFVSIDGAPASFGRVSETQISINLQNAPNCAAFKITINKGIPSAVNNEIGDDSWFFDGRIVCGYSKTIGYSVQGRAIVAYYFGSGSKSILFTGGMHGSEPSSVSTMQAWVRHLQANAATLVPTGTVAVVVPDTNPDGGATGARNNANNVNIDRNFPTANWKADIETYSGLLVNGGGTSAGSETETQALMQLTRELRPRAEISFHAQGSLVGANKFADSVAIGDTYASTVKYGTMYSNAEAVMGYAMTGEYEDWMGEELGIPAILIELPTHSGNYINSQLNALKKMLVL